MTVSIGNVVLDDSLLLAGDINESKLSQQIKTTLSGRTVVSSAVKQGGRKLTLTTNGQNGSLYGRFLRQQLLDLAAIRDAGTPVQLVHNSGTWPVTVIPPDGINVDLVVSRADPKTTSWYKGSITLIEV
jgi:hypothetical protein